MSLQVLSSCIRGRKHTVVTAETIKGRLLMEMNYMLAYGSGEASLRLLWNSGSLHILLPFEVTKETLLEASHIQFFQNNYSHMAALDYFGVGQRYFSSHIRWKNGLSG
ncbi:hypothetical protein JHK87_016320 [Glycine soja]|nr:hypothetical protein JHK87_016320 [Glycine soja]